MWYNSLIQCNEVDYIMINQLLNKMEGAYAENTIKAYRTDFEVFTNWCKSNDLCPLPAEPERLETN